MDTTIKIMNKNYFELNPIELKNEKKSTHVCTQRSNSQKKTHSIHLYFIQIPTAK